MSRAVTVTMDSAGWTEDLIAVRVLADVEDTCHVDRIDDTTFRVTAVGDDDGAMARVTAALEAHPAVTTYVEVAS